MLVLLSLLLACSSADPQPEPPQPVSKILPTNPIKAGGLHCGSPSIVEVSCELVEEPGTFVSVCRDGDSRAVHYGPRAKAMWTQTEGLVFTEQAPNPQFSTRSWSFDREGTTWVISDQRVEKERNVEVTKRVVDGSSTSWLCR